MQNIQKNYILIDSVEKARELYVVLKNAEYITLDIETNSLNPRKAIIIGISFCCEVGVSYYIPTKFYDKDKDSLEVYTIGENDGDTIVKHYLDLLKDKKLITHNGAYDLAVIYHYYGINLINDLWIDTILLVHTVQEEGAFGYGDPFGLKSIAKMVQDKIGLNVDEEANKEQIELKESIERNGGSITKDNYEIWKADMEVLAKYGASDTDLTYRICLLFYEVLKSEGLEKLFFEEEVMPLYKEVTIPMQMIGIRLDIPFIEQSQKEIEKEIEFYKNKVLDKLLITAEAKEWVLETALSNFPIKNTGAFAQLFVDKYFPDKLPKTDSGAYSLSKNNTRFIVDYDLKKFLLGLPMDNITEEQLQQVSIELWEKSNDGSRLNLNSTKQLGEIIFKKFKVEPLSYTEKGSPQFNEDFIDYLKDKFDWANDLRTYNKLGKIKSTYIDRFLDNHEDGIYYFYYKQHGTVSGRYSSDAQQLPKPIEKGKDEEVIIEYTNRIRKFMIPRDGNVFIDCDYSSLEPRTFCAVSSDDNLRKIFDDGLDFYSYIAILTEKLKDVTADEKDDNFLKKIDPTKRQSAKAYCFTGEHFVQTPTGFKLLKHVQVGDFVKSESGYNVVLRKYVRKVFELYNVVTTTGIFKCTPDHPFYVEGEWIKAEDLKPGMKLKFKVDSPKENNKISKNIYKSFSYYHEYEEKYYGLSNVPYAVINGSLDSKLKFIGYILDNFGKVTSKYGRININVPKGTVKGMLGKICLLFSSLDVYYKIDYNEEKRRWVIVLMRGSLHILKELNILDYVYKNSIYRAIYISYKFSHIQQNFKKVKNGYETVVSEVMYSTRYLNEYREHLVYDIKVNKDYNFYLNGVLVHNCLGIPYGMTYFALAKTLGVDKEEGKKLHEGYLDAFPGVHKWMVRSQDFFKAHGYVRNKVGRVRHLDKGKKAYDKYGDKLLDYRFREDLAKKIGEKKATKLYLDLKNALNSSTNSQIQSLAAAVVNRAAIQINRKFRELGLVGWVCTQIHDQLIIEGSKDNKELLASIVQEKMESMSDLVGIELKAPPEIAMNWYEGH